MCAPRRYERGGEGVASVEGSGVERGARGGNVELEERKRKREDEPDERGDARRRPGNDM